MRDGEVFWAYGVVTGPWSPPEALRGVDDQAVETVAHADLAVLASAVPASDFSSAALRRRLEDLETLAQLARAHDHVLHAALAGTDVAPFPICTLYETRDALEDMLRAKADHFRSVLMRLRDMTEWGVKGFRVAVASDEPARPPSSGAEYLAHRRAQRDQADDALAAVETAAADVHHALSQSAAASMLAPPQDRRVSGRDAEMILNGVYLIERAQAETFAELVDEQRRRHADDGLALEITGPWPPYNFVAEPS